MVRETPHWSEGNLLQAKRAEPLVARPFRHSGISCARIANVLQCTKHSAPSQLGARWSGGGCRRWESNPHGLSPTRLRCARVYQFRHAGHPERRRNPGRAGAQHDATPHNAPTREFTISAPETDQITKLTRHVAELRGHHLGDVTVEGPGSQGDRTTHPSNVTVRGTTSPAVRPVNRRSVNRDRTVMRKLLI